MVHSNAVAGSSSGQPTPDSQRTRSRVQFSDDQGSSDPEAHPRSSRAGAGSPQSRKSTQASRSSAGADARRHARSLAARSLLPADISPLAMFPGTGGNGLAQSAGEAKDSFGFSHDSTTDVFSDEYDLSHEDPKILKDVQHALKLKARREARLQGLTSSSPPKEMLSRTTTPPDSSLPSSTQLLHPSTPGTKPSQRTDPRTSTEIDFSPSTGTISLHPVPSSSNHGATLDWTGSTSDDERSERKWTLSVTKAKSKDKSSLASKTVVEKQESIFMDKITRIQNEASPLTQRKAQITREQLQRRYDLIYRSLKGASPLNPVGAVRWYTSSVSDLRTTLDEAEPLTWLKHLLERRGRKPKSRLPWHLTALILEEYVRSQSRSEAMETIPEDSTAVSPPNSISHSSPKPPTYIRSRPSSQSHNSLGPSISGRLSYDGHVSFEPYVESTRTSLEGDSRRSADGHLKPWVQSSRINDSPHSSLYSSNNPSISSSTQINNRPDILPSPSSNRAQTHEFSNRMRSRPYGSDGGSSSALNSMSEDQSRSDDGIGQRKKVKRARPSSLAAKPTSTLPQNEGRAVRSLPTSETEDYPAFALKPLQSVNTRPATLSEAGASTAMPRPDTKAEPTTNTDQSLRPRKAVRMSLPAGRAPAAEEPKRAYHYDRDIEEKEQTEYELKAQLLDETMSRNHRLRQMLQRVAGSVREYDLLQRNLMESLSVPHSSISPELLDAFSHDPAAVTAATRRYRGWRAVEDIHNRISRQRETFRAFLANSEDCGFFPPNSVFDEPINALSQSLTQLEDRRKTTLVKAREVAGVLTKVKGIHASVKTEYNETLSHTSVVYPELSQIVALEESYKDQYQQLWEIGMDTLTFLLDTVTPVWRNYGKTIGEDVQDFLIIPLYRNEFTGEAKRYPILGPPRRSVRHWLGLMLFFVIVVGATTFQARAAISFVSYYRLPWNALNGLRWAIMPFFWVAFIMQIVAVLVEFCIVVAQLGVVVWWLGWLLKIFN